MISFAKISKLTGAVLAAVSLSVNAADTPKRVDVKQLSKKVEDVVVPLPNEVFGALNKLGGVNWREYVRNDKGANFTERPRIATNVTWRDQTSVVLLTFWGAIG